VTTAAKARVVRAALVLLALWPVVQHALVRRTEVSPWKLAGWGMYAAPQDNVGVVVLVEDPRTSETVVLPREALPQEFWNAASEFSDKRWAAGRWVRPDDLGRRVLELVPPAPSVTIVVGRLYVDRETATVRLDRTPYEYRRD